MCAKVLFVKQGDCSEFRKNKRKLEEQREKNDSTPKKRKKSVPTGTKYHRIFKSFNGVQYFIKNIRNKQDAELMRKIVDDNSDKFDGDIAAFRILVKKIFEQESN